MELTVIALMTSVVAGYVLAGWLLLRVVRQRGPLRRSLFVLLVLFTVDGLMMGQGFITFLVALLAVVAQLVLSAWRALKRDAPRSLAHLGAAGVYVMTVAVVVGYLAVNNRLAVRRAGEVIAACRAYEATHGQLPNALRELVPAFLPAVPRAKYTAMFGDFTYFASRADDSGPTSATPSHTLMYVQLPPFGRRLYHFENNSWSTLD